MKYLQKENITWNEINDLFATIANHELNDFEFMESLLFTEEEAKEGDEKWWKYVGDFNPEELYGDKCHGALPYEYVLFVPIWNPNCIQEFQLNHFVMWNVIAHCYPESKPKMIKYYFNPRIKGTPVHTCYCCASCQGDDEIVDCDYCPIWGECRENYPNDDIFCEIEDTFFPAYLNWFELSDKILRSCSEQMIRKYVKKASKFAKEMIYATWTKW